MADQSVSRPFTIAPQQLDRVTGGYYTVSPEEFVKMGNECPNTIKTVGSEPGGLVRSRVRVWDQKEGFGGDFDAAAFAIRCAKDH